METPATGDGLIRVFISSPSDVRSERLIAERLIQRLHVEFSYHFRVEPVLWEREPLVATEHFQASLVPPSETDIVVVILWSRLGVSLPIDTFPGKVTGRVVTGTEWEFEDALSAYRRRGLPHLLFYRKTAPVMASLDDPDAVRQQLHQKQLVQDFVKRWFVDSDAKTLTAAFREFTTASEFEDMLGTHLRELLQRRLENAESVEPRGGIRWHQGSPYRGLEVFELSHAQIFFGRARERTEIRELLVRRIEAKNAFLLIFGASGSGKSSIVRAGLLADLTLPGMIGDVALCRYALFRPSDAPDDLLMGLAAALMAPAALPELGELRHDVSRLATLLCDAPQHLATPIEAALARAAAHAHLTERGEARIVLVIDQLEEIFTIDRIDANDRAAFVTAIDALARSGLIWVVATMRSDFFQRLPELPLLSTMSSGEGRYLLGPPDAVALRQIIRQPAIEAGLRFQRDRVRELDLADQVERDARESRDALPLLEFALDQLWQRRSDRGEMTFAAYEALGSLEGAIGHRAEQEFLQHPPEVQAALPVVLRALSASGPDAAVTARTVALARFRAGTAERRLIDALIAPDARLLVASGDGESALIRVAHEAVLTHWERARKQLAVDRADLQTRTRLEEAAALWRNDPGADRASLLLNPGLPLATAEDLVRRVPDALDHSVVEFIQASSAAAHREARRSRRVLQLTAAVFAVLAVLASATAWMARAERSSARSGELAAIAQGQIAGDPERSVLLAIAALEERETPQAVSILRRTLDRVQRRLLTGHRGRVRIAGSDDGRLVVTAGHDGDARIWDVATGQLVRVLSPKAGAIHDARFSRDGRTLLTASEDEVVRVWDAAAGSVLRELRGHVRDAYGVAPGPDRNLAASGGRDGSVRIWDIAVGRETRVIDTRIAKEQDTAVNSVEFSADGRWIVASGEDSSASVWNVTEGTLLARLPHAGFVVSSAFSPDGRRIATASSDFVRVWSVEGVTLLWENKHDVNVTAVGFDAEGRYLAAGDALGRTRIWRTDAYTLERELVGHRGGVRSVNLLPGGLVATAGDDGTARIWVYQAAQTFGNHRGAVTNAAFSPDGRRLVTASADRQVRVWDTATGQLQHMFTADAGDVISALFSPDGRSIVTAGAAGSARVWTVNGTLQRELTGHAVTVNGAVFSANSKLIATASKDGRVRLFKAATGALVRELGGEAGEVFAATFSPNGQLVAAGGSDGRLRVWSTLDGQLAYQFQVHERPIYGVAFDRDGKWIATSSLDGSARIWNASTRARIGDVSHSGQGLNVEFSPDGRFLVTGSTDGVARVWEVETQNLVMHAIAGKPLRGVAFRPDGRAIVTAGGDSAARIFTCEVCALTSELEALAHERVKRELIDK